MSGQIFGTPVFLEPHRNLKILIDGICRMQSPNPSSGSYSIDLSQKFLRPHLCKTILSQAEAETTCLAIFFNSQT